MQLLWLVDKDYEGTHNASCALVTPMITKPRNYMFYEFGRGISKINDYESLKLRLLYYWLFTFW